MGVGGTIWSCPMIVTRAVDVKIQLCDFPSVVSPKHAATSVQRRCKLTHSRLRIITLILLDFSETLMVSRKGPWRDAGTGLKFNDSAHAAYYAGSKLGTWRHH